MTFRVVTTIAFLLVSSSCAGEPARPSIAQAAIDHCVEEYTRRTGHGLAEEVDRANVRAGKGQVDVLFTRGESGLFGKRSESYRANVFCGVLVTDSLTVYDLSSPLHDPLVHDPEVKQVTDGNPVEGIREMLYLRTGPGFHFVSEQSYDPDRILIDDVDPDGEDWLE